jgi:exodeoxyribonuclease V alpha subunit
MKTEPIFLREWISEFSPKPKVSENQETGKSKSKSKIQEDDTQNLTSILQDLLIAGRMGHLCIPLNSEIEKELEKLPQGRLIQENNLLYFQKTWQAKKDLEDGFRKLIEYTKSYREKFAKKYTDDKINQAIAEIEKRWNEKRKNENETESEGSSSKPFALNDQQKQAIREAVRSPFHIITGGPGTGKTTVVAFLMEVLNELAYSTGQKELPDLEDIAIAAPTGRAGQRLTESIQFSWENMDSRIPQFHEIKGTTIHRLLKFQNHTQKFFFNKDRSFLHRLVLVDEVSMVDIFIFQSLFQALPDLDGNREVLPFRLILLGDPNQLPSVEKGAVFRDILQEIETKWKDDPAFRSILLTELKLSNRHSSEEGKKILGLANSLLPDDSSNTTLVPSSLSDFWKDFESNIEKQEPNLTRIQKDFRIRDLACKYLWDKVFQPQIKSIIDLNLSNQKDTSKTGVIPSADTFSKWTTENKCLTLYRRGRFGIKGLQSLIDNNIRRYLNHSANKKIPRILLKNRLYYPGLPIIITKNDSIRKLFNGDIGFVLLDRGELRACFLIDGLIREFALDTLPEHEEAFFLTVHKSQGSEYENLYFYIPPIRGKDKADSIDDSEDNGLANRQVLYTGITRAKKSLEIFGSEEGWKEAIRTQEERLTGFRL